MVLSRGGDGGAWGFEWWYVRVGMNRFVGIRVELWERFGLVDGS